MSSEIQVLANQVNDLRKDIRAMMETIGKLATEVSELIFKLAGEPGEPTKITERVYL